MMRFRGLSRHHLRNAYSMCVAVQTISFFLLPTNSLVAATSTFDSDSEGWFVSDIVQPIANPPQVVSTSGVTFQATGGNPTGNIFAGDISGNATYFSAPAKFLGDQSTAFGGTFSYDMLLTGGLAGDGSVEAIFVGGGLTLMGEVSPASFPNSSWSTISIDMVGQSFNVNSPGGSIATDGELQQVLGDLTGIHILADFSSNSETTFLDNVNLVPEPTTLALLFIGIGSIAMKRER